jgi:hypothetical protein
MVDLLGGDRCHVLYLARFAKPLLKLFGELGKVGSERR